MTVYVVVTGKVNYKSSHKPAKVTAHIEKVVKVCMVTYQTVPYFIAGIVASTL